VIIGGEAAILLAIRTFRILHAEIAEDAKFFQGIFLANLAFLA
jgi:hypothetical protein